MGPALANNHIDIDFFFLIFTTQKEMHLSHIRYNKIDKTVETMILLKTATHSVRFCCLPYSQVSMISKKLYNRMIV